MKSKILVTLAALMVCAGNAPGAYAQTVFTENFTDNTLNNTWYSFLGACLTAGTGGVSIPACVGDSYYSGQTQVGGASGTLPDSLGNGALRFTNGYPYYNQAGGIISGFTWSMGEGLQATFTTISYLGNSGGGAGDGADGMSFFLVDAGTPDANGNFNAPYDLGAFGGSLAYSCSNTNNDSKLHPDGSARGYDGLKNGYMGLGIDEYGNFLNPGDNTVTGPGYQPLRFGLRGPGSVLWSSLNATWPNYYPSTLNSSQRASAVQKACSTGRVWNFSNPNSPVELSTTLNDYAMIPGSASVLPSSTPIAKESATKRAQATPIAYKIKITSSGLLSFWYSYNGGAYQSVIANEDLQAINGTTVPQYFRFGFAGSTGGSDNIHEVICFQAAPSDLAQSSAGLNEKQTAQVQIGTQVYFAFYNPTTYAGSLTSQSLLYTAAQPASGNTPATAASLSIAPIANWDASCVLTGVPAGQVCKATNATNQTAQAPSARTILTWNGSHGIPFEWNNLTSSEQSTLDLGDATPINNTRLNFLRGDISNEVNSVGVGLYRNRASILGDIIDSSPTWEGPPNITYPTTWSDSLYPNTSMAENSGQTYTAFESEYSSRLNVVYGGANDGLMHGFRSGAFVNGSYVSTSPTPNDGQEVIAYMPAEVLATIHQFSSASTSSASSAAALDYANPQYGHAFSVDATPGVGDVFYNGTWHSWLVSGLGAGGADIFALDITDPTNFSESNASSLVIGDWTASSLVCVNAPTNCGQYLGNTYGVPQIRRFHNGSWGAVFGNGLNTSGGYAGIYVMLVDHTGAVTFYYLPTSGTAAGNGIAYVTAADLDGDHVVDYVYAGDVSGKLWRFDLTSANPANWAASSSPLFTTSSGQPITTQVTVGSVASTGSAPRVIVSFGTGQQVPFTNTTATSYATAQQALYGIWDWNLAAWNSLGSTQYATLSGTQSITTTLLEQQTVLGSYNSNTAGVGSGLRTVSSNPVCWKGSTTCATSSNGTNPNVQYGWELVLPGTNEQVIYNPILEVGAFIVNTTIPANNSPTSCTVNNASGWTMALNPGTGGAFTQSFFADASGNYVTINGQVVSGIALDGTGSPTIVTAGPTSTSGTTTTGTSTSVSTGTPSSGSGSGVAISTPAGGASTNLCSNDYMITQTGSGTGSALGINPSCNSVGNRLTWTQKR